MATIAAYGPDDTLATKLVVSVLSGPDDDLVEMRKWTTVQVDVRHDRTIAADVAAFLGEHRVKESVTHDGIIGCPHEEGVDYPMGRTCPRCPFWANIDRFTRKPLAPPEPTMSPSEILTELSEDLTVPPYEALTSADGHRQTLVPPLLRAIERAIADPTGCSEADASLFSYALYLLAKWREPRAYPYVCQWLSLPGEGPFDIGGDVVTEDGPRILAAVCDGDLGPIKALILNRNANEYARSTAVQALALLAAWAEVPRDSVVDHFLWLAREGLEREPSHAWESLASACVDIEALAVFPQLWRAGDDELIDPRFMDLSELDQIEAAPRGQSLEETQDRWPPIDDVAEAISWWGGFHDANEAAAAGEGPASSVKIGRNEPCPCGSGKKYKKCHGA